jgi:hypothetical protein
LRNGPLLRDRPLKFRNTSIHFYAPENSCLLAGLHWTADYSSFHQQPSTSAAMFLTERYIVIILKKNLPGFSSERV